MVILRSVDDITTIMRQILIAQSEIDSNFVRDAESVFGSDLDKTDDNEIFESIEQDDAMILFSLEDRQNESDMSQTQDDDTILFYKSYTMHVIIYGSKSATIVAKLISRLRTQKIRTTLQTKGIYVEQVSNESELHEFNNSTMWERHDFDIDISCTLSIDQIEPEYSVQSLNNAFVIKNI